MSPVVVTQILSGICKLEPLERRLSSNSGLSVLLSIDGEGVVLIGREVAIGDSLDEGEGVRGAFFLVFSGLRKAHVKMPSRLRSPRYARTMKIQNIQSRGVSTGSCTCACAPRLNMVKAKQTFAAMVWVSPKTVIKAKFVLVEVFLPFHVSSHSSWSLL